MLQLLSPFNSVVVCFDMALMPSIEKNAINFLLDPYFAYFTLKTETCVKRVPVINKSVYDIDGTRFDLHGYQMKNIYDSTFREVTLEVAARKQFAVIRSTVGPRHSI